MCEGTVIPIEREVELLGVVVGSKLKFEGHISKICKKLSQQVAVLNRMKKMLPLEIRKQLYQSFIVPHFNYCSESWHFCGKRLSDKLEKLNERALRFVYRDYSTPYETLLIKNGHTTLVNQRLGKMMGTVFRAVNNNNISASISELLMLRSSSYNLRGHAILTLPKVSSTTYGLNSWSYRASKLWNSLPNSLRMLNNYKTFKNNISKMNLAELSLK